jgi:hypothetical protein
LKGFEGIVEGRKQQWVGIWNKNHKYFRIYYYKEGEQVLLCGLSGII